MRLTIENGQFFLATIEGEQTLHNTRTDAISHFKENAQHVNPKSNSVSIERVTIEDDGWTLETLRWDRIAMELINGGDAQ